MVGVYNATKFALPALAEALRRETLDDGVRVCVIEPGRVATEVRDHTRPEVLASLPDAFAHVTPLDPADIAEAVVFALTQSPNVHVSEMLVRPARSPM